MLKKVLVAAAMPAAFGRACASVGVNAANEDALRTVKGIRPAKAKSILDERTAHGPFKGPCDLAKRVKGMGGHTVERLQAEGLAVGPASAAGGAPAANAQDNTAATGTTAAAQKDDAAVVVRE